jgi:hypothetical protein
MLVKTKSTRPVGEVDAWCIICMVARPGNRRQGVNRRRLQGAVDSARSLGTPAAEANPVDAEGHMDLTMAFAGTREPFEQPGFEVIAVSDAQASRLPRLIMSRVL